MATEETPDFSPLMDTLSVHLYTEQFPLKYRNELMPAH